MGCALHKWNVQWIIRLGLHGENIIPYDVLASSTVCWSEATGLVQWIQWTNGMSIAQMECPMDNSFMFAWGEILYPLMY